MMKEYLLATLLLLFCTATSTLFAALDDPVLQAEKETRQALQAATKEEALPYLEKAIDLYETLQADTGAANHAIYGKLGALYLRKGDLGNAILNLKKGLLFAPQDKRLLADLEVARSQRADQFHEEPKEGPIRTLAFFHFVLGYHTRTNIALAAWTLLAMLSAALLWKRSLWMESLTILLAVVALLFGTSAAITACEMKARTPAVIAAEETMPRKGDGEAYTPAIQAPLHAGTEVQILRQRGDWALAQLPGDDINAWIPLKDLAHAGK